jgi:hypothetical protein
MTAFVYGTVLVWAGTLVLLELGATATADGGTHAPRWFPDRPPAQFEHDDNDVPRPPEINDMQDLDTTLILRDGLANEIDRALALEGRPPSQDVNAADEVPCSTWYCARNHIRSMTPTEVAVGPPADAPVLPLTIVRGKDHGATTGFQVADARGHVFMLKMDPTGHLGLATGGEIIGHRVFHAAGYNVPGAFLLDLAPEDLKLDPHATFSFDSVLKRPLTALRVAQQLQGVARLPDDRIRAVAVPWVGGQIVGTFDLIGRRPDDPNDRIPHQHRRSLRANWVLYAWLSVKDPSAINTLDSYVAEGGRHFVRHYHFDFDRAFGSTLLQVDSPYQGGEYPLEIGRSLVALATLGAYHRPFENHAEFQRLTTRYRSIGYFPAEGFNPDNFKGNRKVPTHQRMTDRDAYWGAKLVTSFTDAQIAAVVATARVPEPDGSYVEHALRVRRDIIGRRYLGAMAAVEEPEVSEASGDGPRVCFRDLVVERGYAPASGLAYQVQVSDGWGRTIMVTEYPARGAHTCVPAGGPGPGTGYRVVAVTSRPGGPGQSASKTTRIHLRWRDRERRFVVVGLERDE